MSVWKPSVTVAAVIERQGRFLLIQERIGGRLVLNQPAGHLDPGESLAAACRREAMEETAHHFEPTALVGIYRWRDPRKDFTFLRFAFRGTVGAADSEEFRKRLLHEAGVAVLADIHFGMRVPGEGQHVRFSYAASNKAIEAGVQRMADFIKKNTKKAA